MKDPTYPTTPQTPPREIVRETVIVEEQKPSLLSNILAIIGFIILIVIIIWGLIHIASLSAPWFSSMFQGNANTAIVVSAPATTTSGETMTITWKYAPSTGGTYAFLYQCNDGLRLAAPGIDGTMNTIPCGAAVTLANNNKTLSITPLLSGSVSVTEPLTIIFMPSATSSKQAQGSASVKVNPSLSMSPATSTPVTPTPTTPSTPTPTPSTPIPPQPSTPTYIPRSTTPSDLSVRIISATIDGSGQGVLIFDIANVGGSSTGVYSFSAQLPTQVNYFYTSPPQMPLGPGAHIVNTLRFTQATGGTASISVNGNDANKGNNYSSQYLSPPAGGAYQNYNNYYYTQPMQYQYQQYQYTY